MSEAKRKISQMFKIIKRREERRKRRKQFDVEFSSHQLLNMVKLDQKLILMVK